MALELIGVRATIEGLDSYLAGAKAVNSATDNMGAAASRAGALGAKMADGLKLAATAAGALGVALGGASIVSAGRFQTIMAQVDALTNTTSEDTAKLSQGILDLAKRVPKSPDELGTAAYYALSSGITDVNDALAVVEFAAKAAAAGLGQTKDVVDIVTAALNGYGKENITAAQATDQLIAIVREGKGEPAQLATGLGSLIPLGAALKIPFSDLGGIFASLTNVIGGPDGTYQAATQLRGIMSQIIGPSDAAKKALAATGQFAEIMTTEFVPATKSAADLSAAQTDLTQAQTELNIAQKEAATVLRANGPNSLQYERAQLAVSKATQAVNKAEGDLNKTQAATKGTTKQTTDAFGSLRKEIQDKGLVAALEHLKAAFGNDVEGLNTLFPDIRGLTGFMSAIEDQGPQTAAIVERVRASAGLTNESFDRLSKTFNFQVGLLKNELNIELIKLGNLVLPTVTRGIEGLITASTNLSHLFGLGFNGGEIGGEFSGIETAAFKAGEEVAAFFKFLSDHKDDAKILAEGSLQVLQSAFKWYIDNKEVLLGSLGAIGLFFLVSNPIWAGIIGTGAIIVGLGVLHQKLESLSDPMLDFREAIVKAELELANLINKNPFGQLQKGILKLTGRGEKTPPLQFNTQSLEDQLKAIQGEKIQREILQNAAQFEQGRSPTLNTEQLKQRLKEDLAFIVQTNNVEGKTFSTIKHLTDAYDGLTGKAGIAIHDIPGLATVLDNVGTSAEQTAGKFGGIGEAATAQVPEVGGAAVKWGEAVVGAQDTIGLTADKFNGIGQAAGDQTDDIAAAATNWNTSLASTVIAASDTATALAAAGQAVIEGFFGAINAAIPRVNGVVDNFTGAFLQAVYDAFGIQSPSRVMADVGKNIDQGFAVGVAADKGLVAGAGKDLTQYLAGGINAGIPAVSSALNNITKQIVSATDAWRHTLDNWRSGLPLTPTSTSPSSPQPSRFPLSGGTVSGTSGSGGGTGGIGFASLASGGFVNNPMLAMLHSPEVVLPLSSPMRSREIIASLPPQFRQQVFNSPMLTNNFNIQGATLDQQEMQIVRTVHSMFRQMRSQSVGAGASLPRGLG